MTIDKLVLDLELVLPDLPDEQDACVERITTLLQGEGIEHAHVLREGGKARLCMHYE